MRNTRLSEVLEVQSVYIRSKKNMKYFKNPIIIFEFATS